MERYTRESLLAELKEQGHVIRSVEQPPRTVKMTDELLDDIVFIRNTGMDLDITIDEMLADLGLTRDDLDKLGDPL